MVALICVFIVASTISASVIPRLDRLRVTMWGANVAQGPLAISDVFERSFESTVMAEPNMKPLFKRQDPVPAPQAGEQITIFANGELKDSKYADLFTCKLPGPPPPAPPKSDPPPPPPPPPETVFVVGYFEAQPGGLPKGISGGSITSAAIFKGQEGDDPNVCTSTPVYRDQNFKQDEHPGESAKDIEKLTFDGAGRKACEYDRSGKDNASLVCDGVFAKCEEVRERPKGVDCKRRSSLGETTEKCIRQAVCTF
ncbi:MAG: hypothetical protein Q9166_000638 [cf. Caloplaca sp. 2 TL-2023]